MPEKKDQGRETDHVFGRGPMTPHVLKMRKHKERQHRAWHLPAWLTLSFWFRRKPKPPKVPKPQPEPSQAPVPEVPKPEMPRVPVAPITPEVPTPLPEKVLETTPVIPKTPIINIIPREEVSTAEPVAAPKLVPTSDGITAIPSEVPAPDRAQNKKRFSFGKSKKPSLGAMFHIPQLAAFDPKTEDAREVNLIPGDFSLRSWSTVGKMMILVFLATAALVAVISGALTFWRLQVETRTAEIDREIEQFRDDILVYRTQEPEMTAIGGKIELINELLSQHIYWTNFFSLLEGYTLPDVWYSGLAATTNGTLTLDAHGSSFETVSKTIILLNSDAAKEFVTEATAFDAVLITDEDGAEQVDFSIELTLNPELFYYNETR